MLWILQRFGLYIFVYYGLMQCGFMIEVTGGQSGCREVVRNEYFVGIIPVFQLFQKKKRIIKAILCNFSMRLLKYF